MTFGFIGTGNMGGALARALARKVDPSNLFLSNRTTAKTEALAAELSARASSNREIAALCDFIFLGVKPQMMADLLTTLSSILDGRQKPAVLVTMAAGLTRDAIRQMAGVDCPVIRIMPNTPVAVGAGVILYTPDETLSTAERSAFETSLAAAGSLEEIPESLMDAGCALSGCGPAFVYLFQQALAEGAAAAGLSMETALRLAAGTLLGAAKLQLETGTDPAALKQAVCSPGGSTLAGVGVLEQKQFTETVRQAVQASYARAVELGRGK